MAQGQNGFIDSLRISSLTELNDSAKAGLFCKIGKEFWYINIDSANYYTKKARQIAEQKGIKGLIPYCYNNDGVVDFLQADYSNALKKYFEGLKSANSNNIIKSILLNNIGMTYRELMDFEKAKEYYGKTIEVKKQIGDSSRYATTYINIGNIASALGQYEKAKCYFDTALVLADKFDDGYSLADAYGNIGNYYFRNKNYTEAEEFCKKSLGVKKQLDDQYGYATSLSDLAAIYMAENKNALVKGTLEEAEEISTRNNYVDLLLPLYRNYSSFYKKKGDFDKATYYLEKAIEIKDTILEDSKLRDAAVRENQYNSEITRVKDSLENITRTNELRLQHENEIYRQKSYTFIGIFAFVATLIVSLFIYRAFISKKRTNAIITLQKEEVIKQKELVEEHRKEILDSIHYAKRIQRALLASKEFVDQFIPQNFIFFNPKDIVSGDFYWAAKTENYFYMAVCDSTGHGVPGAFMSLLNIGYLSEAINEKDIIDPAAVFNHTRMRLIESMSREGQKDGFDGILIRYDLKSKKLVYTAANNKPVLISDGEIKVLPADKMPVGYGELQNSFVTHTIDYKPGDSLFLYTDGFADQFGGPKGKKFKYKPLDEFLLSGVGENMNIQHDLLKNKFFEWKGDLEQVDDVCVIGIRL